MSVDGLILDGRSIGMPEGEGIRVTNFNSRDVPLVKSRGIIQDYRWLVSHENAGTANVHKFLKRAKNMRYIYHLVVDIAGFIYQLADLRDKLWHGGRLNPNAIGVVFLNGYYPNLSYPGQDIIKPEWWTHCPKGRTKGYADLSYAQLRTAERLFPFLANFFGIPYEFPTRHLNAGQPRIKLWRLRAKPEPGIVAHRDYSKHADGRRVVEHLISQEERFNCIHWTSND